MNACDQGQTKNAGAFTSIAKHKKLGFASWYSCFAVEKMKFKLRLYTVGLHVKNDVSVTYIDLARV